MLAVAEETDVNGTHRLLQLRNPHGKGEWRGAWSDGSEEWTDLMRARLQLDENSKDGVFWMSLEDLLIQFKCV
jgi:calpain-15